MAKNKVKASKEDRIFNGLSYVEIALSMVICWVLSLYLPFRWVVLLSMLGLPLSVAVQVALFRFSRDKAFLWAMPFLVGIGLMSLLGFAVTMGSYTYYQESLPAFWEVSLAIGLAVGLFVTVKWVWKDSGIGWRIGSIVLVSVVTAVFLLIFIQHMNYLLDFQPPAERYAVIEDKDVTRHHKSPDSYEFEMSLDGETFELEVGRREYNRYEVGDTYTFKEYTGAFGKPFYVAED